MEIKLHTNSLRKMKSLYHMLVKNCNISEKQIKLMTESIYSAITPRLIFVFKPVLKIELKDPIAYLDKSCIIYRFNFSLTGAILTKFKPFKNKVQRTRSQVCETFY